MPKQTAWTGGHTRAHGAILGGEVLPVATSPCRREVSKSRWTRQIWTHHTPLRAAKKHNAAALDQDFSAAVLAQLSRFWFCHPPVAFDVSTGGQDVHDGRSGVNHCCRPDLTNVTKDNDWQPFNCGEGWDVMFGKCGWWRRSRERPGRCSASIVAGITVNISAGALGSASSRTGPDASRNETRNCGRTQARHYQLNEGRH